jgi:7,8-dihydropterin-6-yl-methyl-4-(beta-D-ribofuranosyl)aminobenzene 5'-phosphate synthase
MHLVTLVENTTRREDLIAQHGLSLYLVSHGKQILFDMGQDKTFHHNAVKLGIDISDIDYAILSHGHYDHCGGLSIFLQYNSSAPIYLGSGCDKLFYSERPEKYRYIGLDNNLLKENEGRFHWVAKSCEVDSGIHLISDFHMGESRPGGNRGLLIREGGKYNPDPFAHEILLVICEPDGIILATGCGHSGILNMVLAAKKYFPNMHIKAVIGGFHLIGESRQEIERIAYKLLELGCARVITGHCTGEDAIHIMNEILGDRLDHLHTGYSADL